MEDWEIRVQGRGLGFHGLSMACRRHIGSEECRVWALAYTPSTLPYTVKPENRKALTRLGPGRDPRGGGRGRGGRRGTGPVLVFSPTVFWLCSFVGSSGSVDL